MDRSLTSSRHADGAALRERRTTGTPDGRWLEPRDEAADGLAPVNVARVLLAEHDRATSLRIHEVIDTSPRFVIGAEEATAVRAVSSAVRDPPDVCLLDIDVPGGGTTAAWEINARLPHTKIVMLGDSRRDGRIVVALAAGATGFVHTDLGLERLPLVLARVMEGEVAIPRASVARLAAELRDGRARRRAVTAREHAARLTSREWEVLDLLCEGQDTAGIGRRLDISQATVRSHIAGSLRKLGLPDRESAVRLLGRR